MVERDPQRRDRPGRNLRRALALACILSAQAASAELSTQLPGGGFAAIQGARGGTHCSGVMIAEDKVLTDRSCLLDRRGVPLAGLSVMPGHHLPDDIRGEARVARRHFPLAIALPTGAPRLAIAQLGRWPDAPPASGFIRPDPAGIPPGGASVVIAAYDGAAQTTYRCAYTHEGGARGRVDCALPSSARGGAVLYDGRLLGVVSRIEADGAAITRLTPEKPLGASEVVRVDPQVFVGAIVLNTCDKPVHQALVWLDRPRGRMADLAWEVPARSWAVLPVASFGDRVFTHANTGDGQFVWGGADFEARINGFDLTLREIPVREGEGEILLRYACDETGD